MAANIKVYENAQMVKSSYIDENNMTQPPTQPQTAMDFTERDVLSSKASISSTNSRQSGRDFTQNVDQNLRKPFSFDGDD